MTPRIERYDTVVVGGGQAGLAVGKQLAARDIDHVILDAESRVGDTSGLQRTSRYGVPCTAGAPAGQG